MKITWELAEQFVKKIPVPIGCTGVYGIPRGGLCLAVMISHYHSLPLLGAPYKGCLVVDDIADTGETLRAYQNKGVRITTLAKRHTCPISVYHYGILISSPEWIDFPWEVQH